MGILRHFSLILMAMALVMAEGINAYASSQQCNDLLSRRSPHALATHDNDRSSERRPITDLATFGQAMTEGMLLRPEQEDLFNIYKKIFLGDVRNSNDQTLKSVADILEKHPELTKPHLREYKIRTTEKQFETPESLSRYVRSQISTAGQLRSSLFQIEANIGFWKKIIGYADPEMPAGLTKDQKKEFTETSNLRMMRYIDRIISEELRGFLRNEQTPYRSKTLALFRLLKRLYKHMDRRGRDTRIIRQAMVDLVATTGFGNQATQKLLKSKNGIDKIEGLKKIFEERDAAAKTLGFKGQFQELMGSLQIDFPTGSSKGENVFQILANLETEVLNGPSITLSSDVTRVRSLSIQEAPFRGCLGKDCSTDSYFNKALDPNYNYFTLTDSRAQSSGHVTVVLGTAKSRENQDVSIGFVDKIQNIPNNMIINVLEAVRLSLAEHGYLLGVPEDTGDHNGLSSVDATTHFFTQEILPKLTEHLTGFTPHPNRYNFESGHSRASDQLSIRIFKMDPIHQGVQFTPGPKHQTFWADSGLEKGKLLRGLMALRESSQERDILRYISSGQLLENFEKLENFDEVASRALNQFADDLSQFIKDASRSFTVRKQALFELLLFENNEHSLSDEKVSRAFSEMEWRQLTSEIKQWSKSSDKRKKAFWEQVESKWDQAILSSDILTLEKMSRLKLIDVNRRNVSGFTGLLIAANMNQRKAVDWFSQHPKFDLTAKNAQGYTDLEILKLIGRSQLIADSPKLLAAQTETANHRQFSPKERHADGSPIIAFAKIPAGSFLMGDGQNHVLVEITKPFEFMSVDTTQNMWETIVHLAKRKLSFESFNNSDANQINPVPSHFRGDKNLPVEQVSFSDVEAWLQCLNKLSDMDDVEVQTTLKDLFPGHVRGHYYGLPSEYQYEYVARNLGLAEGLKYSSGNSEDSLKGEAWYLANSGSKAHPVGMKKPVMVAGQPIYDIHGNVWKWMSNWFSDTLLGGVDPQGPTVGYYRVFRGGSWSSRPSSAATSYRGLYDPGYRSDDLGFRLLRNSAQ